MLFVVSTVKMENLTGKLFQGYLVASYTRDIRFYSKGNVSATPPPRLRGRATESPNCVGGEGAALPSNPH